MSQKGILVALLLGCCGSAAQADTQTRQLNLPAIASKDTRMEIALTHQAFNPSIQIRRGIPPIPWLPISAARISIPPISCKPKAIWPPATRDRH